MDGLFFVFLAMFSVMISVGWGRVAYVMLSGHGAKSANLHKFVHSKWLKWGLLAHMRAKCVLFFKKKSLKCCGLIKLH